MKGVTSQGGQGTGCTELQVCEVTGAALAITRVPVETTCLGTSQEFSQRLYPLLSLLQLSHSNTLFCHLSLPIPSYLSAPFPTA